MTNSIGDRIGQILSEKHLKKVEFADKLRINQSYVTQLTSGKRNPSGRLISAICREFRVSETWLRTGEGEMFLEQSQDEELEAFISEIMQGEPDFRRRLVSVLARLSPDEWRMLERAARELAEDD